MADKKISALTSLTQGDVAASTDVLPIVDTSATETKKITASALVGAGMTAGVTNVDINSGAIDGTTIGANSAAAGTFTNLTASGTVSFSGAAVSNGGTVATIDINGGTIDATSIGASSASTGAFTTLTTSSTVTLSGGTANGVLYLNGSKVATSGSALVFDGTTVLTTPRINITNTGTGATFSSSGGSGMRVYGSSGTNQWDVYLNGANIRFSDNTGGGVVKIDTGAVIDGNVGIGTASPVARLDVFKTSNDTVSRTNAVGAFGDYASLGAGLLLQQTLSSPYGFALQAANAANSVQFPLLLNPSGGNVGIGTASPGAKLQVVGTGQFGGTGADGAVQFLRSSDGGAVASMAFVSATTEVKLNNALSGPMTFYTNNTERARLDSSGNLGLGVTPSAWSQFVAFEMGTRGNSISSYNSGGVYVGTNCYFNGTNWLYKIDGAGTAPAQYYAANGSHVWQTAASGTANSTTIVSGNQYTIVTAGGNFTAFGAANNNVGTVFTATSSGTATGGAATQTIVFTQAMTLDASGNLGVGTTSPGNFSGTVKLVVGSAAATTTAGAVTVYSGTATYGGLYFADGTVGDQLYRGAVEYNHSTDALLLYSAGAERARITAGGYFKASNDGTYVSSTGTYHELRSTTNNSRTVSIHSAASNGTQYGLLISTANDQADATRYFLSCEGGGVERATIRSNGGLANYSANDVNLASDERLKKDISPLNTAWDKVKDIEVVNYRYKDCNEGDPLLYGVIAQQVQPIVPELVVVTREAKEATEDQEATPEFYGIREQPMYWLAIKALQEAMARIESLEADMAALKGAK